MLEGKLLLALSSCTTRIEMLRSITLREISAVGFEKGITSLGCKRWSEKGNILVPDQIKLADDTAYILEFPCRLGTVYPYHIATFET